MEATFVMLGSGASTGIPIIGCDCETCTSNNPKNIRMRPSALLKLQNKTLLIDVGPDFRQQALKHQIYSIDGLLLTHVHFDHIAGIDELRTYYFRTKKPLPCLLSAESLDELKLRYHYLFQPIGKVTTMSAQLEFQMLEEESGNVDFEDTSIDYCSYFQGPMKVTGYRIGNLSYISDIREYEEGIFDILKGTETLILSALREDVSPVHFNIEEAIEFAQKVGAKQTFFTHIAHSIEHEKVEKRLPKGIHLGYDGLTLTFDDMR